MEYIVNEGLYERAKGCMGMLHDDFIQETYKEKEVFGLP